MLRSARNLLSATLLLSLALMAGRLAGLGRELLLAKSFGLSAQADMAVVLLSLPDLLVNLLLSGGIGVALVPLLRGASDGEAALLLRQASLVVGGLFAVLGLLFVLTPALWLRLLAPGIDSAAQPLSGWLLGALAAAIILTALSGVTAAALNARDRFFVAGCGTLIFNLAIIAALILILWQQSTELNTLVAGIAIGAGLRWGTQWQALRSLRKSHHGASGWRIGRALLRGFAAGLTAASLLALVPVLLRAAASMLGEGELAAFNYANKLVELPLGVLITTIATVAFPRLSGAFHEKNAHAFDALLTAAIARSLLMSFAVVLCGWPIMDDVVVLLFGYGKPSATELAHIADLARIALLSVPWVGLAGLAAAALNAQRRPQQVLRRTLLALLALPLLCLPGLIYGQAEWLMWALPAFYLLCSASLLSGSRCFMQKGHRLLGRPLVQLSLWLGLLALLLYALNSWLLAEYLNPSNLLHRLARIALAGLCFFILLMATIPILRILRKQGIEPTD